MNIYIQDDIIVGADPCGCPEQQQMGLVGNYEGHVRKKYKLPKDISYRPLQSSMYVLHA
jgi:hypothetical protein